MSKEFEIFAKKVDLLLLYQKQFILNNDPRSSGMEHLEEMRKLEKEIGKLYDQLMAKILNNGFPKTNTENIF